MRNCLVHPRTGNEQSKIIQVGFDVSSQGESLRVLVGVVRVGRMENSSDLVRATSQRKGQYKKSR